MKRNLSYDLRYESCEQRFRGYFNFIAVRSAYYFGVAWKISFPCKSSVMTNLSFTLQTDDVTIGITRWFGGEWVTANIRYIRTFLFQVWQNRFLYFGVLIGNYGLVGSYLPYLFDYTPRRLLNFPAFPMRRLFEGGVCFEITFLNHWQQLL